jgi:hypothetical protein
MVSFNPDIKNRYIKLSWMGMGDAINKPDMVYDVTLRLLDWIFENKYAIGLDGVDLSTVMPKLNNSNWIVILHDLETRLKKYNRNPIYEMDNIEYTNNQYSHRNLFRLFYSIGSPIQEKRDNVIPNAMPLESTARLLNKYMDNGKYTVILHHLLVDGLNDSDKELDELIDFVNKYFKDNELRILRYNACFKESYRESEKIISQIRKLSDNLNFLKVQISPGTEVSAACGQFIVKDFIKK